MATQVLDLPGGLSFAAFYYPEILRELLLFLRNNKDSIGLTDENELEVHVQLLAAFAFVGHLNNTRLDTLATELFLDSAQLLDSVKKQLRLMGIELQSATPSVALLLAKLSSATSAAITGFVPSLAEFETSSADPIAFEADEDGIDLDRTDRVSGVYSLSIKESAANGSVIVGSDVFTRGAGTWPASVVGHEIYILASAYGNRGTYKVTERVSDTQVRLVKVPDSEEPAFQTESSLSWDRRQYSSDYSTQANGVGVFTPFAAVPLEQDALYIAHTLAMPTKVGLTFSTPAAGIGGVWEYYDSERSQFEPTSVTDNMDGTLTFDITSLLGDTDVHGAWVKVIYLKTWAEEVVTSVYAGGANKITTTTYLGQVSPSEDVEDYYITADWVPFSNVTDTTIISSLPLRQDGYVSWDLPQDADRSWNLRDVNDIEGAWFRFRIVSVVGPTTPVFDRVRIDQGDQYIAFNVIQGRSIIEQVIGSSSGNASQSFDLPNTPYIDDTETIEVDEGGAGTWTEWLYVKAFTYSSATSRHYRRELDAKGVATIYFGDGVNGRIPPAGTENVRASYRVGGGDNGNVGADQITVNADAVPRITSVTNPRGATGWRIFEGGDALDLARVKRDGPASMRIRDTGAKAADIERLAIDVFTDASGIKAVARAYAVEEGYGTKTVKLLVVGVGGGPLTGTQLADLDEYFNGDRYARPPVYGVIALNQQVTSTNYEPAVITVQASVVWPGGNAESIKNALLAFLDPLVTDDDGSTWLWDFGAQVSFSKVSALIHSIDPAISDIPILLMAKGGAAPAASSVSLDNNELPVAKSTTITINILQS